MTSAASKPALLSLLPLKVSSLFVRPPSPRKKLAALLASLIVILVAVLILRHFLPDFHSGASDSAVIPHEKQRAVLPFTVADPDAQKVALGAGLTETLTAQLTQLTRDPLPPGSPRPRSSPHAHRER